MLEKGLVSFSMVAEIPWSAESSADVILSNSQFLLLNLHKLLIAQGRKKPKPLFL